VPGRREDRPFGENWDETALPGSGDQDFGMARRKRGWGIGRLIRRIVLLGLFLLALPYLLVLLYRAEFVRPVSTLMLYDLARGSGYERQWTRFDDIAPVLVQSVMMSEDGQFCAHNGVDWSALNAIIDGALEGEATRGASTIPMQAAKNLYLWPGRSFVRKALEIPIAVAADTWWPKRRMMEIYLNVAEWAPGVYGIGAAAQHHFGVSAAQLSPRQAALLAVTLPNPHRRTPAQPSAGLQRLASTIEARASRSGAYIGCLYNR
jgi:monofunctional glycosyltransferase